MEPSLLTRRQFLGAAGAAALLRNSHLLDVHNDAVGLQVRLVGGVATTRRFFNRLTGESIPLSPELFQLQFHDGSSLSSLDFATEVSQPGIRGAIDLLFTHPGGLEVRVRHSTTRTGHYLRKQISIRDRSATRRRLVRADLENWQGVGRRWTSMQADHNPFGSHPVYCDDLWAGVEFVAAFNNCMVTGLGNAASLSCAIRPTKTAPSRSISGRPARLPA